MVTTNTSYIYRLIFVFSFLAGCLLCIREDTKYFSYFNSSNSSTREVLLLHLLHRRRISGTERFKTCLRSQNWHVVVTGFEPGPSDFKDYALFSFLNLFIFGCVGSQLQVRASLQLCAGSVVAVCGLSCPEACRILAPGPGIPLDHQGSSSKNMPLNTTVHARSAATQEWDMYGMYSVEVFFQRADLSSGRIRHTAPGRVSAEQIS